MDIEREEREKYFREMLGGVKRKEVKEGEVTKEVRVEGELEKVEIRRAIRNLKEGKAIGIDGIPSEVWKYGGKDW